MKLDEVQNLEAAHFLPVVKRHPVALVEGRGSRVRDVEGREFVDLTAGWGVTCIGHCNPALVRAISEQAERLMQTTNIFYTLPQAELIERLASITPEAITRSFLVNSGTEATEGAIKLAHRATGRAKYVSTENSFHGRTLGALGVIGQVKHREPYAALLHEATVIPYDDLDAAAEAVDGETAAFIVEPIQGHGVNLPGDDYLGEAARLCRKHGALFVADEIQTGMGRTGRFWAIEHWDVEPDMLLSAKALSGGFVPVGAVALRKKTFDALFSNMVRAPVHGSTFSKNNLAMAAGIATLDVIAEENLVENAAKVGEGILEDLRALVDRYQFMKEVRGKGMMQGIEFAPPSGLKAKAAWKLLDTAQKGLFTQLVTVPLLKRHRILSQTAGHDLPVVKFLPPLTIGDADREWIVGAVDQVVGDTEKVGGAIWDLGKNLASAAIRTKAGR